jgi:hypothetical protein
MSDAYTFCMSEYLVRIKFFGNDDRVQSESVRVLALDEEEAMEIAVESFERDSGRWAEEARVVNEGT